MINRYSELYSELKILEYQLKQRSKGRSAALKITGGKRGFVRPEVFEKILGE